MINIKEKGILQDIAKQVAECAQTDKNKRKMKEWTNLNDLVPDTKPLFITHLWQISTKEIFPESTYKCENEEARRYELYLNQRLYFANVLDDDNVIEPVIPYDSAAELVNFPLLTVRKEWKDEPYVGAAEFIPVIIEKDDIKKLTDPELHYDEAATRRNRETAQEIFFRYLTVINKGVHVSAKISDEFSWLRGLDNTYMDYIDDPEWVEEAHERILANMLKRRELVEQAGLARVNDLSQPHGSAGLKYVSGMGDWRTLNNPAIDSNPFSDKWGFTCSEVCTCVSNSMHEQLSYKYDKQLMEGYKLINVGCCEVLDKKIPLIRRNFPNTRKISVSEWCDVSNAAKEIRGDYVYSYRAAGVPFVNNPWDIKSAEKELSSVLQAAKDNGCLLEIVLNIGGTFGDGEPRKKLMEWTQLTKKLIAKYYE